MGLADDAGVAVERQPHDGGRSAGVAGAGGTPPRRDLPAGWGAQPGPRPSREAPHSYRGHSGHTASNLLWKCYARRGRIAIIGSQLARRIHSPCCCVARRRALTTMMLTRAMMASSPKMIVATKYAP
jgi:hypothetical protein